MATGFFRKQPSERYPVTVDFATNVLASGESVSDQTVVVTDEAGTDVTSTIISGTPTESAGVVTLVVQGGTDGSRYMISVSVDTDASYTYDMDVVMEVLEQP